MDQRDRAEVLGEVVGGAVVVLRRALARDVPTIVALLAEDRLRRRPRGHHRRGGPG